MSISNPPLYMANASTTPLTNSTTQTSLMPTSFFGSKTIPAGSMFSGKSFIIRGGGVFSTALTPGTFTIRIKLGTVTVASVALTNVLSLASNNAFEFECDIDCRSAGSSGTILVDGHLTYATGANTRGFADLNNAGAATTIDTTVDQTVDITGQWSIANAANSITVTKSKIDQLYFI